jgi:5-methyltetrahydrofolate corrinoid/iron sulfur protein methyltransferase
MADEARFFNTLVRRKSMQVIANNITSRAKPVAALFKKYQGGKVEEQEAASLGIQKMASACIDAGADMLEINLQQRNDLPAVMEFAVRAVQEVSNNQLCLSAGNAATLEAGLKVCRRPPVVNFVSLHLTELQDILPLVSRYGADVVFLVSDPAQPADGREMLERGAVLVGAANQLGIPNEKVWIDPGLFHITYDLGQRHLGDVMDVIQAIPDAFDPAVKTTCWIGNSSTGAPSGLRSIIESHLLVMLAGLGLSSVFMDVLNPANMRAVRLVRVFRNEIVYADGLFER